jgi:hypothetical protein
MVEPCEIQYHLYRYTYEPYIEEGGFESYHEKRNKFCVVYVTSLHENPSQGNCGYLALLPSDEPINMLYPRYTTFGMHVYMMANTEVDDEVVEIVPVTKVQPREVIDLTLDEDDNNSSTKKLIPTRLSYDSGSSEEAQYHVVTQQTSKAKVSESKLVFQRKLDSLDSPVTSPRKRVRDKSPRNAPQNLLLLKRIYRNICAPSEYKPLYPDGRGKIDEPPDSYYTGDKEKEDGTLKYQRAPPKGTTLKSRPMRKDIYATSSSSSSDGDDKCTTKEHSLNSLHFTDLTEEMNALTDGDTVAPWSNPNEEEAPELLDVPEPCSFREVLDSMEKSIEHKFEVESCSQAQILKVYFCPNTNQYLFPTIGVVFRILSLCILKPYQLFLCLSNPKLVQ